MLTLLFPLPQPINPSAPPKFGVGGRSEELVKNALAIFEQDTAFGEGPYAGWEKPLVQYCTSEGGQVVRRLGVPTLFPASARTERPQRGRLPTTAGDGEGEARSTLEWEE